MKYHSFRILFLIFVISCGNIEKKNPLQAEEKSFAVENSDGDFRESISNSNELISPDGAPYGNEETSTEREYDKKELEYDKGYKFGHSMGYFDGKDNSDYSPYLPVGPNVSSFSFDYRQGYAAGYSAGYEEGQEKADLNSCVIVYDDDDDFYFYDDEDY